jgi:ubiquinone/menaquinone biosynthesis C-methylase UbiE
MSVTYVNLATAGRTVNDYTAMQKRYYENETPRMKIQNHKHHNENPDYWNVLLSPLKDGDWSDKIVLDFGCGCGRNVQNILNNFSVKEAHGCDISSNNVNHCTQTTPEETNGKTNFKFVTVDGQSLRPLESDTYDFIMSTIVLQHICVYTVRRKILEDMFRCLKPGAMISLQMGFGMGHPTTADYYENATHADSTNSGYDVRVTDPNQIKKDLDEIGFVDFEFQILQPYSDAHQNWIYFKARKPQ